MASLYEPAPPRALIHYLEMGRNKDGLLSLLPYELGGLRRWAEVIETKGTLLPRFGSVKLNWENRRSRRSK